MEFKIYKDNFILAKNINFLKSEKRSFFVSFSKSISVNIFCVDIL